VVNVLKSQSQVHLALTFCSIALISGDLIPGKNGDEGTSDGRFIKIFY